LAGWNTVEDRDGEVQRRLSIENSIACESDTAAILQTYADRLSDRMSGNLLCCWIFLGLFDHGRCRDVERQRCSIKVCLGEIINDISDYH